jgi:restriction endonuclease Mrr
MDFPSIPDVAEQLEFYLADHGPCRVTDVYEPLADKFGLTVDQRTATNGRYADPLWAYRVRRARQVLKNRGLMAATKNGVWDLVREQEASPVVHEANPLVEQVAA